MPPARVRVVLPRASAYAPAVAVALEDVQSHAGWVGGVAGLLRGPVGGALADLGLVESARLEAAFTIQVWATTAADVENIVRRVATLALEDQVREREDPAGNRRTRERFLRFAPQSLRPTARPPTVAASTNLLARDLVFAGLYERTTAPLTQESPPIQSIPVTYQVDTQSGGAAEQETIARP